MNPDSSPDTTGAPASMRMLNDCIPLFEVLKDPHRQQMFVQLVEHGEMTIGELAATTTLDRTTVSHHLKALRAAGLVEEQKLGTRRICRPRTSQALNQLRSLITALEADLAAAQACRRDGTPPPTPRS